MAAGSEAPEEAERDTEALGTGPSGTGGVSCRTTPPGAMGGEREGGLFGLIWET